jgi:hypothetical protein
MRPLRLLMSRAVLVGSRGRAKHYGRSEPQGRDYDFVVLSHNTADHRRLVTLVENLCGSCAAFKLKRRLTGVTARSSRLSIDISIVPEREWSWILEFWRIQEEGGTKTQACVFIESARREWLERTA